MFRTSFGDKRGRPGSDQLLCEQPSIETSISVGLRTVKGREVKVWVDGVELFTTEIRFRLAIRLRRPMQFSRRVRWRAWTAIG
jgi:hypothetical protein